MTQMNARRAFKINMFEGITDRKITSKTFQKILMNSQNPMFGL